MTAPVVRGSHPAVALTGSFGATLIIQVLNSATGIILARVFVPSARGELAAILLWPNLFGVVATIGLFESTTYHVASRQAPRGAIIGSGMALAAIQSLVFTALAAMALPLIMHRYSAHALFVSFTYLPYIPLSVLSLMLLGVVNGVSRDTPFHLMRVLVIVVSAILLLILALVRELTFEAAAISYLVAQVVTLFWSLVLSLRQAEGELRVERRLMKSMFVYGLSSHSSSISSQLNQRLDVLVVSLFLSARDLGLYSIASSITSVS
jgi:O-antigen/teichoic acid export membrane protein